MPNNYATSETQVSQRKRNRERGAALVTALMVSMLILALGSTLLLTTTMSATNAIDATAEMQAYYAAEAGLQASLTVIRGNVQPNPLFNSTVTSADNKITFRQAVNVPDLSRWLVYNGTHSRVPISDNYLPLSGMAYHTRVSDPDNTGTVVYSVSGSFPGNSNSSTYTPAYATNNDRVTIIYTAPATNPTTVNSSQSNLSLGSFTLTPGNSAQFDANIISGTGIDFNLIIAQSAPYPASSASPKVAVIPCKITGTISKLSANNTVKIVFQTLTHNINDATYTKNSATFNLAYASATAISPVTVTAPEPTRLLVKVTGYGPRGAMKQMQMMVNKYSIDYIANAAITIRGADGSGSPATINLGSSAQYIYSGFDNAGGPASPAISVTNAADYASLSQAAPVGGTQVIGSAPVQQVSIPSLSTLLQTAQGARDAANYYRERSKGVYTPGCAVTPATIADCDRYFPLGTSPNSYGDEDNVLTTFVDGDAALPPAGGAGLLIVTGTLDMRGSAEFKGLILVLGDGVVIRNGGGNGTSLGSIVVARFGSTGDFLAPTFDSNGGGTSDVKYDSKWVNRALASSGPRVVAVSEY